MAGGEAGLCGVPAGAGARGGHADRWGRRVEQRALLFFLFFFRSGDCGLPLHSFWIEGCEAPTVRDKVIGYRMKPGMKPVARQPIPLSPYDDLRVEFQIEEFVADGKLRAVDTP